MTSKDDRIKIPRPGELHYHLLQIDAFTSGRSVPEQCNTVIGYSMQRRMEIIKKKLAYSASLRNLDPKELWIMIISGEKIELLTPEELRKVNALDNDIWDLL